MKRRQTSFELLRVVAMLMVMTLHVNFSAIGVPTYDTILSFGGVARTFLQMLCISAVNAFVMISGWFGIRPSVKGFINFMWQVAYFVGLSCAIGYFAFDKPVGIRDFIRCFGLLDGGGWFVASYIGLYILSPVLNVYVKMTSPKHIFTLLIAFFTFELLWGNSL
ncbi:MAG: hypothetical protein HDR46_05915, partial [Bacteroides sp.]|nr:hypothetical protein [Bacteroides sp.]